MLMSEFKIKDLGELNDFTGIDFTITQRCVKIIQKRYIGRVLVRFDMSNCKPRTTPCKQRMDLSNTDPVDSRKYREIVRSLIYLMTCTRPDMNYAIGKLSQHLSDLRQQHWIAAKHILIYLRDTSQYNLCYKKSEELKILAYRCSLGI